MHPCFEGWVALSAKGRAGDATAGGLALNSPLSFRNPRLGMFLWPFFYDKLINGLVTSMGARRDMFQERRAGLLIAP